MDAFKQSGQLRPRAYVTPLAHLSYLTSALSLQPRQASRILKTITANVHIWTSRFLSYHPGFDIEVSFVSLPVDFCTAPAPGIATNGRILGLDASIRRYIRLMLWRLQARTDWRSSQRGAVLLPYSMLCTASRRWCAHDSDVISIPPSLPPPSTTSPSSTQDRPPISTQSVASPSPPIRESCCSLSTYETNQHY